MITKQTSEEKMRSIDFYLDKLRHIAGTAIRKSRYNTAMAALSAYSTICYNVNQRYTDNEAEEFVLKLSRDLVERPNGYVADKDTVLFYDGFGLDLRGWAASYVKALVSAGYNVVYVTKGEAKNRIPHIINELQDNTAVYLNTGSYVTWVNELSEVFSFYRPGAAFFYTTPYDVPGAVVFASYGGFATRFLVDLTDHAFWLGVKSVDFLLDCREMGASIAVYSRGVPSDKIIRIDCVPYINRDINYSPLPFNIEDCRYVFSGGALYKTLGDTKLLYYKAIKDIMEYDADVKFLYAGSGDSSEMEKLIGLFPNRVFLIEERSDFYRIIENSEFYLNTYPMFGGLMMRYAALAGKIPITLKHDNDGEGILINQKKLGIEFDEYEGFINEIKRILSDSKYKKKKEELLQASVIDEETFIRNIKMIIGHHRSEFKFEEISFIDTSLFRSEYIERFDVKQDIETAVAAKRNTPIAIYFPRLFMKRLLIKLTKRRLK